MFYDYDKNKYLHMNMITSCNLQPCNMYNNNGTACNRGFTPTQTQLLTLMIRG